MGFIFDVEKFIYSNINHIAELIESGYIRKHYEVDFIKLLLLNKSRMNANRIWRVLVLETFINQLQTQNH